jgi:hypothetical protein
MIRLSSTMFGFAFRSGASFLVLAIQFQQDRDFDRARGGENAVGVTRKDPAIGQIENRHAHDAIELGSDFFDAGLELFPKQIAARVVLNRFRLLLATSNGGARCHDRECGTSHNVCEEPRGFSRGIDRHRAAYNYSRPDAL